MDERKEAMIVAGKFLAEEGRPNWTPITRLIESGESGVFKSYFKVWDQRKAQLNFAAWRSGIAEDGRRISSIAASKKQEDIDIMAMVERQQKDEASIDDDGSGTVRSASGVACAGGHSQGRGGDCNGQRAEGALFAPCALRARAVAFGTT